MKLISRVGLYKVMPRGFGAAYWDACRRQEVCAPFGLHLLLRFFRSVWERWVVLCPSKFERLLMEVGKRGWDEGFENGRYLGVVDFAAFAATSGFMDGKDAERLLDMWGEEQRKKDADTGPHDGEQGHPYDDDIGD